MSELPAVPLTIEGASVLHQMMRVRWSAWRELPSEERASILAEASALLERHGNRSALFSLLGHKGDIMLVHFRDDFEQLKANRARHREAPAVGLSRTCYLVPVGHRTRIVRVHPKGLHVFGREWYRAVFGRMERGDRGYVQRQRER